MAYYRHLVFLLISFFTVSCGGGSSFETAETVTTVEVDSDTPPTVELFCGESQILLDSEFTGCTYTVSDKEDSITSLDIETNFTLYTHMPGRHTLSITVTDTDGNTVTEIETITVYVALNDRDGDGYLNEEENQCGTDPDNAADIPIDSTGIGMCDGIAKRTDIDGDLVPALYDWDDYDPLESKDEDGDGIGNLADKDERIIIYATKYVLQSLSEQLEQFRNDVSYDTRATVSIELSPSNPKLLRALIRDAYNSTTLKGIFLVGNIPDFIVPTDIEETARTDHPYRAPNCAYREDLEYDHILHIDEDQRNTVGCEVKFWLARIHPSQPYEVGLNQLKTYFERNHQMRYSHNSWKPSMQFLNAGLRSYTPNYEPLLPNILHKHTLYTLDDIVISLEPEAKDQYQFWIDTLQSNVEIAKINIHGSARAIQFQGTDEGDDLWFTREQLHSLRVKPKFIDITSCSVGNVSQGSFLAGDFLYDGDTLLVSAVPSKFFVTSQEFPSTMRFDHFAYGSGATPGEVFFHLSGGSVKHLYGDPTIKIRDVPVTDIRPRMIIDSEHYTESFVHKLSFEPGKYRYKLPIYNSGNKELILRGMSKFGMSISLDGRYPGPGRIVFSIAEENIRTTTNGGFSLTIPPGETKTLDFHFTPGGRVESLKPGMLFEAIYRIASNDPINPVFSILVNGEIVE